MAFSVRTLGKVDLLLHRRPPSALGPGNRGAAGRGSQDPFRRVDGRLFRQKRARSRGASHDGPEARNLARVRMLEKVAAGRGNLRVAAECRFHRDARLRLPAEAAAPAGDPARFAEEQQRLYKEYAEAYAGNFAENLPENGVPCRFTVHVVDVPDKAASYEFYSTALLKVHCGRRRDMQEVDRWQGYTPMPYTPAG